VTARRSAGDDAAFDHDCSTLGGNSGSPIVSLKTGYVVGVHREGFFLERNVAVRSNCIQSFVSKCKL
jgi:endonuclease G